jgi:hypothetical protein
MEIPVKRMPLEASGFDVAWHLNLRDPAGAQFCVLRFPVPVDGNIESVDGQQQMDMCNRNGT